MAEQLFELSSGTGSDLYNIIVKDMLDNRVLILNQEISDDIVETCVMQIIKWNIDDIAIPTEKRKKILLVINSVGGDTYTAMNMCDVIMSSNTPVYAIGLGLTASAAYYIYLSCHKRYAYKNSVFLQHDGCISISNSTKKAAETFQFFENAEARTKNFVLNRTKMSEEFYDEHYDQEYYFYPDKGKELGAVDYIIGEDVSFEEIFEC